MFLSITVHDNDFGYPLLHIVRVITEQVKREQTPIKVGTQVISNESTTLKNLKEMPTDNLKGYMVQMLLGANLLGGWGGLCSLDCSLEWANKPKTQKELEADALHTIKYFSEGMKIVRADKKEEVSVENGWQNGEVVILDLDTLYMWME